MRNLVYVCNRDLSDLIKLFDDDTSHDYSFSISTDLGSSQDTLIIIRIQFKYNCKFRMFLPRITPHLQKKQ